MKTPEDEAFDELARKQGMWGGGFPAKRKMAADKLWDKPSVAFDEWWNGDNDESTNPFRLESGAYWAWAGWKAALAQPAQETVCDKDPQGCWNVRCQLGKQCKNLAQPVHCQCTACKDGILHASDCAVHNGPAYPAGPCDCGVAQEREWVGLTDEEVMEMMGYDKQYGHIPQYARNFVEAISAKLKEKNT